MRDGMLDFYPQEELTAIVAELANGLVSGDSTSVTYEQAQALMEAVLYCLNEYEQSVQGSHYIQKDMTVREMYDLGYGMVLNKARRLRENYNRLTENFDDYGMICLRDTAITGIAAFIKRYDARFAPQETLLTLDYPVLMDISGLSGVDAVFEYVRCIEYEQQFLGKFDGGYIREILRRYHKDYEHLFENICHIVMMNLLGHIILQKPLADQGFDREELQQISRMIAEQTEEETEKYIAGFIASLIEKYYRGNDELQNYFQRNCHALTVRIRFALSVGHPEKVFLI